MLDILSVVPGKKKLTQSGWYSFNAPCCVNRGHSADRRMRGGIIFDDQQNWTYHCFNCHYKAGFRLGKQLTKNTRLLLSWFGLDEYVINKISFESFSHRDVLDLRTKKSKAVVINFPVKQLSDTCVRLNASYTEHQRYIEYLRSRGLSEHSYSYYVDSDATRPGIIIPYFYNDDIVGNTCRFLDDRKPKYLSDQPSGYVFNIDAQFKNDNWSSCILVEGQFDAISIGGCAYMGSNISDEQAQLINRLNRTIIVVPDQDKSGLQICDRALELGYKVSIPEWHSDVKDVNDAVRRYGKIPTLLSIFQSVTTSKIKVEMAKKRIK